MTTKKIKVIKNNQIRVKKKRKRKAKPIMIPKKQVMIKKIMTRIKMAIKETTKIKMRNRTNKIRNNSCRRRTSAQMTVPIDKLLPYLYFNYRILL